MSKPTLPELRDKIDALDKTIQDLIAERAELVELIGDIKHDAGLPVVNAAREAQLMRRLLSRHRGSLPLQTIMSIWRELIGAACQIQSPFKVAIANPQGLPTRFDMARFYFGSVMPIETSPTALHALGQLRNDDVQFAVVPWPVTEEDQPWWLRLMDEGNADIRVIARLPYDYGLAAIAGDDDLMLLLGRFPFEASGHDHTFVVLQVDPEVSRSRINTLLAAAGLSPLAIFATGVESARGTYLLHLDDYVDAHDARWADAQAAFGPQFQRAFFIGGYAVLSDDEKGN